MDNRELEQLKSIYEDISHSRGPVPDGILLKNGINRLKKFIESTPTNKGECEPLGKVGEYNISIYPPIPEKNQVNVLWIQKDDGEGMSLDLDELWKDF